MKSKQLFVKAAVCLAIASLPLKAMATCPNINQI
jgi:hypothetical protein